MKAYIIYKDASEHGRDVREFLREFERRTGKQLIEIDPDSREGSNFCRVYDVVEYPTILATDDQGVMQNMWRGLPLPQIMEVSYYAK